MADNTLSYLTRRGAASDDPSRISVTFDELREMLTRLEHLVVPELLSQTTALFDELDQFRIRASLIGQVKAGKTALTNAMLGQTDLLPSDVNPWTSVVTSVHINQTAPRNKRAIFKFFDKDDWEGMIETGGRIADMAEKAQLDTEVDDLRAQIIEMQERTTERLGENFQMLLGGQHAFSEYDGDLIKRYVCLGEDDNLQAKEGRFADMTKSADLYMDIPAYSYPITLSDTPGVNDPFLVREAVTLDALGHADVCTVVLSAHQALSTADLALMRILINLKHEQIVLFVNRIDELADPHNQIIEIEKHIRQTLQEQNLPTSIPIIFGSAAWAEARISGTLDVLNEASVEALNSMIEARQGSVDDVSNLSGLSDLSGMSALQDALDRKVVEEVCAPFARDIAKRGAAIALQSRALLTKSASQHAQPVTSEGLDLKEVETKMRDFLESVDDKLETVRATYDEKMKFEISGAFNGFIFREGRALVSYVEGSGQMSEWAPDSESLRRNLNVVYNEVSSELHQSIQSVYDRTHKIFESLYGKLCGESPEELGLNVPQHPRPTTPVSLMRTMTVDFSAGWIANWIARKLNRDSYMKKFQAVTLEQMHATLNEVQQKHIDEYCEVARAKLNDFVDMHMSTLRSHAQLNSHEDLAELRRKLGTADAVDARIAELSDHISEFDHIASWLVERSDEKKIA